MEPFRSNSRIKICPRGVINLINSRHGNFKECCKGLQRSIHPAILKGAFCRGENTSVVLWSSVPVKGWMDTKQKMHL